jgi:hypothetical protein
VWVIDSLDPNFRFEMQGQPVKVNEPILLRNAATNHFAGSDATDIHNTFGRECEAFVFCQATQNKS